MATEEDTYIYSTEAPVFTDTPETTSDDTAQITADGSGSSLININTADKSTLMSLDGIGEKKADSIIEYRTQNGPFSDIHDLQNISGIGKKTVETLAPFITAG
ncbi:helix-hairpin-helix domain-containing protein [Ruminococcus sp. HUN007]|uniref:ComEA family DNA-binding protein n=1 Tax=Ruminococcus sp. HUN007 TaxID=1514668 RepID=UPI000679C388|nr:helix-hairpin-helix domain-containing protein [Ruminococcus sp. HUN007]